MPAGATQARLVASLVVTKLFVAAFSHELQDGTQLPRHTHCNLTHGGTVRYGSAAVAGAPSYRPPPSA